MAAERWGVLAGLIALLAIAVLVALGAVFMAFLDAVNARGRGRENRRWWANRKDPPPPHDPRDL